MSDDAPKPPTTADLLATLVAEIRGMRDDMRKRGGLPDVKIGKSKKHPEYEGRAASECPADVLLDHAGFLEWKADMNRKEGKLDYVPRDEREALMCRRWATVNRNVKAPERAGFRKPDAKDEAPDTQDSKRDPAQPATETRPKWGGSSGWKKAGT